MRIPKHGDLPRPQVHLPDSREQEEDGVKRPGQCKVAPEASRYESK
jgi:hypothetical protein